jgi:hypothetical protein
MNRALVVPIIAAILLILIAQYVISFAVTQVALAKTDGGIKSTNSNEQPTRGDCLGAVGKTGISILFISTCILLYPHDFKKAEGGTLELSDSDSAEGVKPFGQKK